MFTVSKLIFVHKKNKLSGGRFMANIDIIDEYGTNKIFTGAFLGVLFVSLVSQFSNLVGYTIDGVIRLLGGNKDKFLNENEIIYLQEGQLLVSKTK